MTSMAVEGRRDPRTRPRSPGSTPPSRPLAPFAEAAKAGLLGFVPAIAEPGERRARERAPEHAQRRSSGTPARPRAREAGERPHHADPERSVSSSPDVSTGSLPPHDRAGRRLVGLETGPATWLAAPYALACARAARDRRGAAGYPLYQLARALVPEVRHSSFELRARASGSASTTTPTIFHDRQVLDGAPAHDRGSPPFSRSASDDGARRGSFPARAARELSCACRSRPASSSFLVHRRRSSAVSVWAWMVDY